MAKRLFYTGGQAFTATAYNPTTLADGTYMALIGGTATQQVDVLEVLVSGMAIASAVAGMQLVRSSGTIAATFTALASPNSDGPMIPATAALAQPVNSFVAATTKPQGSAATTDARLNLGINVFGGILRWNAAPTQQWQLLGNATGFGCTILMNASAGGGTGSPAANAHIIYEPY
jgi:hypothetical protein